MSTVEIKTQITLDADSNGMRLTPEEFDSVTDYDHLYGYELIDGVVVVNPIPLEEESHPNEVLGGLLFVYQRQHPKGASLDLTLQERYIHMPNQRRRADRVIWAGLGRWPNPKKDVPTIAVEIVSSGRRSWKRDYETKRDEYLAAGVEEYWIIDRFTRVMTVYRGSAVQIVKETDKYTTALLPGFELPLAELLAAADKWEDTE